MTRHRLVRAILWALGLAIIAVAGFSIAGQWSSVRAAARDVHPNWPMVAASGALVLVGYAVLIETWRRVVTALGSRLSVRAAARIWLVSSLARYIPGAAWQMGAMGLMAKQEPGVSPVVATSSAVLMTLVNVLTGLALVAAGGVGRLDVPLASAVLAAVMLVGFALAPKVVAPALRLIARLTGKPLEIPALTWRALLLAVGGTTLGWLLYGVAFELLARAILGESREDTLAYVAAYTGAYLAGFLSLGPPAGLGVADGALVTLLTKFGLADVGGASVLTVAARLWRTVLEVAPGIMVLAYSATRRDSRLSNDAP